MNEEAIKRLLFFFEKLDMDRFKRDYNIPLTVSICPIKAIDMLWRWGDFTFDQYINSRLHLNVQNIVGKTDVDILLEQGYRRQEVTLWCQAYDSDGFRIRHGHFNQIPISDMSTNHIRACLRTRPDRFGDYELLKEELKYRGKG